MHTPKMDQYMSWAPLNAWCQVTESCKGEKSGSVAFKEQTKVTSLARYSQDQ